MIDPHLRIEGYDARSWRALLSLFMASPGDTDGSDPTERDRGGALFVVHDGAGRVLKALHTHRGRLKDVTYAGPASLDGLAREHEVTFAFALRDGAIDEIFERIAVRLARDDDYATQWIAVIRVIREMHDAQILTLWPPALTAFPVPSPGMVRRALDVVLPSERTLCVALFEKEQLWTAAVLRRREGRIDLLAGPEVVAKACGPLGGDWRRDYRVVLAGVERAIAPVHLGLFADIDDARALLRSTEPGAWAKAVLVRDLVIQPMPPYVQVALAADALRAAANASRILTLGIDVPALFAPLARRARDRIGSIASVRATLGFDPLKTLAALLRRAPAGESDKDDDEDDDEKEHDAPREDDDLAR